MHHVVINADDFGLTEGVSTAIVETMLHGVVSSTSAMVCVPGSLERLAESAGALHGRAGLHLQLTGGTPRLPSWRVPTLVDESGRFASRRADLCEFNAAEIEREWMAQYEAFMSTGLAPTHLDAHQHVQKDPAIFDVYCRTALRLGVPARSCGVAMTHELRAAEVSCPDRFECTWSGSGEPAAGLLTRLDRIISKSRMPEIIEVMCHPGYDDDELRQLSKLHIVREIERIALMDDWLADELLLRDISIVPMGVIRQEGACRA